MNTHSPHATPAAAESPDCAHGRDAGHHGHSRHADRATGHDPHANHHSHESMRGRQSPPPPGHGAGRESHVDHTGHEELFRKRFWISLLLSVPVLLFDPMVQHGLGFTMPAIPGSAWLAPAFAILVFLYGGVPFLQMAVPELRNRRPGMMLLISLALSVALGYSLVTLLLPGQMGFFWELVTLIDIMLLGHWIEMRSVRRASGALQELARLMPDTAERLSQDGRAELVPVAELRHDDLVLVRPGASVPVDGTVTAGDSEVNEAMITGESRPVSKQPGDRVIAGTLNGDGSLRVRITATGEQTALAGILRLVQQAQNSKSKTQILADRAAGLLFYIALGVATLTAIVWALAQGFNHDLLARVATVLVIACPHALGLAVPLVVAITTAMGARNGILVRDRLALEQAREITTVVFDKTGTLTKGEFGVVQIVTAGDWEENKALALAAALEGDSEHTLARGIRAAAQSRQLRLPQVSNFVALKGRGVQALRDGTQVYLGGPRLLEMLHIDLPAALSTFAQETDSRGQTAVYLVRDRQVVAGIALADVVRPESAPAVRQLHAMGLQVAMLTGDSKAVAGTVAQALGIDQCFAEVLPEHKDQLVAELQRQGWKVAMVGDGVNDAPALARADVGIAIGSGTEVAVASAGIILVKSNPMDVVKVLQLSRGSYRKMRQNLWWAAGYNLVALPLAAGVLAPFGILLSPAIGAVLMSLSTIVVAINAQLLRRLKLS